MAPPLEVDARGLLCPLPVMRLARALAGAAAGTEALLLADDPLAPLDVEAWCAKEGHLLLAHEESAGTHSLIVRCGHAAS